MKLDSTRLRTPLVAVGFLIAGWSLAWWQLSGSSGQGPKSSALKPAEARLLLRGDEVDYLLEASRAWLDFSSKTAGESRARAWDQFSPRLQESIKLEYHAASIKIERHLVEQHLQVSRIEQVGEGRYRILGQLELFETRPGASRSKLVLPLRQVWELEHVQRDLQHPQGMRVSDWKSDDGREQSAQNDRRGSVDAIPTQTFRVSAEHSLQIQFPCAVTQVDLGQVENLATQIRNQPDAAILTLMSLEGLKSKGQLQVACGDRQASVSISPGPAKSSEAFPVDRYVVISPSSVKPSAQKLKSLQNLKRLKKPAEDEMGFVIDDPPSK